VNTFPDMHERFRILAYRVSDAVGSPWAFALALGTVLAWAVTGPLFHYSDGWQLTINTATTIVTFLMVFLIQTTQNRDARAVHLKLDELIRSTRNARNFFADLEDATDEELRQLQAEFRKLRVSAAARGQGRDQREQRERRRNGRHHPHRHDHPEHHDH
jgi:low affinity Fe/Cu permease